MVGFRIKGPIKYIFTFKIHYLPDLLRRKLIAITPNIPTDRRYK